MRNSPEIVEQYHAVQRVCGWCSRADRGVIEVTGKDRASWLNNLVTNVVKNLSPGEGNYAFATDIKGRVVFDLGILALDDRLWLDVDRRWMEKALRHLNKYVITEDVEIANRTDDIGRIAVIGPATQVIAEKLGVGNFSAMAQWQHLIRRQFIGGLPQDGSSDSAGPIALLLVRNDFTGLPSADFYLTGEHRKVIAQDVEQLARELALPELLRETADILRIEAGIPASVDDIDEDVVPPETGRIEQGISYHKGCYLGQEVIERMRSHGVLARKLVGLKIDDEGNAARNSVIRFEEKDVGRITSMCWSEALTAPLGLGYVKTVHAQPGRELSIVTTNGAVPARIIELPVRK